MANEAYGLAKKAYDDYDKNKKSGEYKRKSQIHLPCCFKDSKGFGDNELYNLTVFFDGSLEISKNPAVPEAPEMPMVPEVPMLEYLEIKDGSKNLHTLEHDYFAEVAAISTKSRKLAFIDHKFKVHLVNYEIGESYELENTCSSENFLNKSIAVSNNGLWVATNQNFQLVIWNLDDRVPRILSDEVKEDTLQRSTKVRFLNEDQSVITTTSAGTVDILDIQSGQVIRSFPSAYDVLGNRYDCSSFDFHEEQNLICISYGYHDNGFMIKIYDLDNGELLQTLEQEEAVTAVGFSRGGTLLFLASGSKVHVYSMYDLPSSL